MEISSYMTVIDFLALLDLSPVAGVVVPKVVGTFPKNGPNAQMTVSHLFTFYDSMRSVP